MNYWLRRWVARSGKFDCVLGVFIGVSGSFNFMLFEHAGQIEYGIEGKSPDGKGKLHWQQPLDYQKLVNFT